MEISNEMAQTLLISFDDNQELVKEVGEIRIKTTIGFNENFDYDSFINALAEEIHWYKVNHTKPFKISMTWNLLKVIHNAMPVNISFDNSPSTIFGIPIVELDEPYMTCIIELEGVK